jgi:beta-glucosidase
LGSESGNSIASVLMGDVNPSGKLPMTFPAKLTDIGAHSLGTYPGTMRKDDSDIVDCNYSEGIFVGYRWIDRNKIKPLFAFGHGLSYTDFKYGKPVISAKKVKKGDTVTVTIPVTNVGSRAGAETVQLYVSDLKSSLPRPVKELKGFKKVTLNPGETADVTFTIGSDALSYFDDAKHQWVAETGAFELLIGASSADIRGKATFDLID